MEDWAADWDMESWEDVTVTPTEYWVRSIVFCLILLYLWLVVFGGIGLLLQSNNGWKNAWNMYVNTYIVLTSATTISNLQYVNMVKMIFLESMMEMISVASPLRWEDGGTTHGKTIQSGMMQVVLKGTAIIFNIIIIIGIISFVVISSFPSWFFGP